jgi:hypothetical protein
MSVMPRTAAQKRTSLEAKSGPRSGNSARLLARVAPTLNSKYSGLIVSTPCDKVFNKLDVLTICRKDGRELLFSRLKHTEGCILRSIDNLYVLQRLVSVA